MDSIVVHVLFCQMDSASLSRHSIISSYLVSFALVSDKDRNAMSQFYVYL